MCTCVGLRACVSTRVLGVHADEKNFVLVCFHCIYEKKHVIIIVIIGNGSGDIVV